MDKEIKKYLIEQCRKWMLNEESKALLRFSFTKESEVDARRSALASYKMELILGFKDEKVNSLVSLGKVLAEEKIAKRILKDNPDILNYCPNCRKLARTPKARQCRYCENKWFD